MIPVPVEAEKNIKTVTVDKAENSKWIMENRKK